MIQWPRTYSGGWVWPPKAKITYTPSKGDNMLGYHEAKMIDDQIGKVMNDHPINADTSMEWATFLRTIQSSLDLINGALKDLPKVCPQCKGKGEVL